MKTNIRKGLRIIRLLHNLGKIRMTDSGPTVLGESILIVPRDLFTRLIEVYQDDPELERHLYRVMKRSVHTFCEELDESKDMDPAEMLDTLLDLTELNGYGHIEISEYDEDVSKAAFYIRSLPSEDVADGVTFKGDTYWAGMLAGGMSYIFDQNIECLETQCVLEDNNSCRFVAAPKETLEQQHPELYNEKFDKPLLVTGER